MTNDDVTYTRPHPAKYSDTVLAAGRLLLEKYGLFEVTDPVDGTQALDPLAGTLKIADAIPELEWTGIEIEREWANHNERTVHGDCIEVMRAWKQDHPWAKFKVIFVSPAYGNRMADPMLPGVGAGRKYTYNTYTFKLGRLLSKRNGAQYVFHRKASGAKYRKLHIQIWRAAVDVLEDGGYFFLNVSDYLCKDYANPIAVTDWHVGVLTRMGLVELERVAVDTPRNREGANADQRVAHEWVIVFRKPAQEIH